MMKFLILLFAVSSISFKVDSWDYLLFVQVWPGSWITNNKYNFNNTYFTVHGIWPDYFNGSWPQFCNNDALNLTDIKDIRKQLEIFWTDFKNPVNFWSHEYRKHASCAKSDPLLKSEHQFFTTGLSLRDKYDLFNILKNNSVVPSNNIKYNTQKISQIISDFLNNTVVIVCDKNNILNEIRICLDKNLRRFDCPNSEIKEQCQNDYVIYNIIE